MSSLRESIPTGAVAPPAAERRIGIVVSRFNSRVTESLLQGALEVLDRAGVARGDVVVVHVPGAWEIPFALDELAAASDFDALIALGAVVRGETPHFEAIVHPCTAGCSSVGLRRRVPVSLGILTCDSTEQALERSGGKLGNKGCEAALAALEMASLVARLRAGGADGV